MTEVTRPAPDAELQKLRDTVRELRRDTAAPGPPVVSRCSVDHRLTKRLATEEAAEAIGVTLSEAEANLVRSALAERWHDQAKYTAAEVSDTLGGGHAASLQDAAWKVREMSTVVDVFEKLGWPGERAI